MSATDHSLRERYGAPSPARRWTVIGVAALLVAAFLGWLLWATLGNADPKVSSELISWKRVDDHRSTAVVRVQFGDGWVEARCTVRARAVDDTTVGEVTFTPARGDAADHEITINTDRRPTTVESLGCTADGQPRPR